MRRILQSEKIRGGLLDIPGWGNLPYPSQVIPFVFLKNILLA
jgi:hypothetical protein